MTLVVNGARDGGGGASLTAASIAAAITSSAEAETVRVALNPQTAYDGSSSTGWTTSNGGTNRAASIGSSRFNCTITAGELGAAAWMPSSDHPRIYRDLSAVLATTSEDWSVVARLAIHSAGGRAGLAVGDTSDASGIFVTVAANGTVSVTGTWGNGADASSGAAALPVDGTGWVCVYSRRGIPGAAYGTGTTTDPPARWAPLPYGNTRHRAVMARLTLYAWDDSGVGATVAWDDVRVIDGR